MAAVAVVTETCLFQSHSVIVSRDASPATVTAAPPLPALTVSQASQKSLHHIFQEVTLKKIEVEVGGRMNFNPDQRDMKLCPTCQT